MSTDLFPGFSADWIDIPEGRFFARSGGREDAPPVILLHGFPQTHACWHPIAPALAETHRVVCLDLKGYGWSEAPKGDAHHEAYSKRRMGRDVVAIMERLGHVRFALVGHDRGARVGYRLALDEPGRIERLALLDILPTLVQWERIEADPDVSSHWASLARPAPPATFSWNGWRRRITRSAAPRWWNAARRRWRWWRPWWRRRWSPPNSTRWWPGWSATSGSAMLPGRSRPPIERVRRHCRREEKTNLGP